MSKNVAVFGLYPTEVTLADGVGQLRVAGFNNTAVSVLFSDSSGNQDRVYDGADLHWLAGMGILSIPGWGPFVGAGPIMAALRGNGIDSGLTGALIGSGMPAYEAKRYEGRLRKGGILLSVRCGSSELEKQAKRILESSGAQDVASTRESKS